MTFNLPTKVRLILYLITALGTPVIAYLFAKGFLGELEVSLWGAEVAIINTMAALNTSNTTRQ